VVTVDSVDRGLNDGEHLGCAGAQQLTLPVAALDTGQPPLNRAPCLQALSQTDVSEHVIVVEVERDLMRRAMRRS
jgi:hypothetical protein